MKKKTPQRWSILRAKIKEQLLACRNESRFQDLVHRLNIVNANNRNTNIRNGMRAEPYIFASVEEVRIALKNS